MEENIVYDVADQTTHAPSYMPCVSNDVDVA